MLPAHDTQRECFFYNPIFLADWFSDLSPKAIESFAAIKQRNQFTEDAKVFCAGDFPSSVYILIKGEALLFSNSKTENEQTARPVETGEILGLTETIACLPHSNDLVTSAPCVFEVIERRNLINFLSRDAEAGFQLVKLLGINLQKHCLPSAAQ